MGSLMRSIKLEGRCYQACRRVLHAKPGTWVAAASRGAAVGTHACTAGQLDSSGLRQMQLVAVPSAGEPDSVGVHCKVQLMT